MVTVWLIWSTTVWAEDTWTDVTPGVRWLHRTTGGSVPQSLHLVEIDLRLSLIHI